MFFTLGIKKYRLLTMEATEHTIYIICQSPIYHLHTQEGADQAQNAYKEVSATQTKHYTSLISQP